VGDKVVDGHLHLLHLLEPEEGLEKQLEVEGVGMVEVVLVHGGQLVLLFIQHLRQAGKGLNEQGQICASTYDEFEVVQGRVPYQQWIRIELSCWIQIQIHVFIFHSNFERSLFTNFKIVIFSNFSFFLLMRITLVSTVHCYNLIIIID